MIQILIDYVAVLPFKSILKWIGIMPLLGVDLFLWPHLHPLLGLLISILTAIVIVIWTGIAIFFHRRWPVSQFHLFWRHCRRPLKRCLQLLRKGPRQSEWPRRPLRPSSIQHLNRRIATRRRFEKWSAYVSCSSNDALWNLCQIPSKHFQWVVLFRIFRIFFCFCFVSQLDKLQNYEGFSHCFGFSLTSGESPPSATSLSSLLLLADWPLELDLEELRLLLRLCLSSNIKLPSSPSLLDWLRPALGLRLCPTHSQIQSISFHKFSSQKHAVHTSARTWSRSCRCRWSGSNRAATVIRAGRAPAAVWTRRVSGFILALTRSCRASALSWCCGISACLRTIRFPAGLWAGWLSAVYWTSFRFTVWSTVTTLWITGRVVWHKQIRGY